MQTFAAAHAALRQTATNGFISRGLLQLCVRCSPHTACKRSELSHAVQIVVDSACITRSMMYLGYFASRVYYNMHATSQPRIDINYVIFI